MNFPFVMSKVISKIPDEHSNYLVDWRKFGEKGLSMLTQVHHTRVLHFASHTAKHDSMWCICVTSYLRYVICTWMPQNIQRRLSKAKYNNWNTPYKTVPSHVAGWRAAKGLKGRTDIIRRECITYYCISVHDNNMILLCLIISRDGHRRRRPYSITIIYFVAPSTEQIESYNIILNAIKRRTWGE